MSKQQSYTYLVTLEKGIGGSQASRDTINVTHKSHKNLIRKQGRNNQYLSNNFQNTYYAGAMNTSSSNNL